MSFNKSRIRQKLANLASGGAASSFWSPPKEGGQATIRAFAIPNSLDPFIELWFHFNVGKQSIYCPKRNGKSNKCPICDLAEELFRGDEDDRAMSKQLYARPRFYAAVVDRADEAPVAKYWGFGKQIYTKLMTWLAEDEGGDHEKFLDPEEGLDLVVSVTKTPGKSFPDTSVDCKRRESALCDSKDLERITGALKSPDEVFPCPSAEDIQGKLDTWLNDTSVDDSKEEAPTEGVSKPPANNSRHGTADQLNALFNEHFPEN